MKFENKKKLQAVFLVCLARFLFVVVGGTLTGKSLYGFNVAFFGALLAGLFEFIVLFIFSWLAVTYYQHLIKEKDK